MIAVIAVFKGDITILGALGVVAITGICLWFLFEAACRHYGWWPELFSINPSKERLP